MTRAAEGAGRNHSHDHEEIVGSQQEEQLR